MKIIRLGSTRMVITLNNKYVLKIARIFGEKENAVVGMRSNIQERKTTIFYTNPHYAFDRDIINYIAPTVFCSVLGLFSIQRRCHIISDKQKIISDINKFNNKFYSISNDIHPENFGYLNNKLVLLDYN